MAMRRRRADEVIDSYRRRLVEDEAEGLRRGLAAWASQVRSDIALPVIPPELTDRPAEIWEPLLALADAAGPAWASTARVAAVAAVADSSRVGDQDTKLLAAIRDVFERSGESKMHTKKLLKKLEKQELTFTSSLDPQRLAAVLAPYGIKPKAFRDGTENTRGYYRDDFSDAWSRYLPP